MKIYKLDIDTSKPTRQVVAMQQNSEGMLSVAIANDGKYIRNLSCSLYDGGDEISATTENGYKIDVGDEIKAVKLVATSAPVECSGQYISNPGNRTPVKTFWLNLAQVSPGVYNQDEFASLANKFGSANGLAVVLTVQNNNDFSKANFNELVIGGTRPDLKWYFKGADGVMPSDGLIVVTDSISIGRNAQAKTGYQLSSETYPAVGYYTDYQFETVIRPTTNAACYAEYDIEEPTPETPEEPEEEPPADASGE